MDTSGESPAAGSRASLSPQPSERVQLARAARTAALGIDGVVGLDPGPTGTFVTEGAGTQVPGVTCIIAPEGGYDVTLQLVCRLVALHAIGERVRTAVETAAVSAGIRAASVTVRITDVSEEKA